MRLFRSLVRVCLVLLAATLAAQARDLGQMTEAEIAALQQRLADGGCYQGHDGFITTSALDFFVEHWVQTLTENKQNPVMGRPPDMPDFTIAQVSK
jgi:hypothetical protein